MSPNTDSCQEELPFKEGQLIKVYGKEDDDGFFYGESNDRSGYIPCNMVSELQADDPEVVKQLLLSEQQQQPTSLQPGDSTDSKHHQKQKKTSSSSSTARTGVTTKSTGGGSSSTMSKQQSTSKTKDSQPQQSSQFAPISSRDQHPYGKSGGSTQPKNLMVALYDYDPHSLSPNVDADVSLSLIAFIKT